MLAVLIGGPLRLSEQRDSSRCEHALRQRGGSMRIQPGDQILGPPADHPSPLCDFGRQERGLSLTKKRFPFIMAAGDALLVGEKQGALLWLTTIQQESGS